MSRCALLPSRGDPITLRLVYYLFETVWQDEVDRLYINVNSQIEKEVVDYIREYTTHPKVVFSHFPRPLDHGNSITKMFNESTGDYIVLMEDDSLIYGKGMLDKYFKMLENNSVDACGSLRWSCSGGLIDRARQYFDLQDNKYLEGGWFWPCFFFAKRADLLKTDLDFRGKGWKPGERVVPMQWMAREEERSDTMVYMSMQLRALKLRFHTFPNPGDIGNSNYQWTHTSSLSSFIESEFTDDNEVPLFIRKSPAKYSINTVLQGEKSEVERKFGYLRLCLNSFDFDKIKEFRDLYEKGMNKIIDKFGLDNNKINGLSDAYRGILKI